LKKREEIHKEKERLKQQRLEAREKERQQRLAKEKERAALAKKKQEEKEALAKQKQARQKEEEEKRRRRLLESEKRKQERLKEAEEKKRQKVEAKKVKVAKEIVEKKDQLETLQKRLLGKLKQTKAQDLSEAKAPSKETLSELPPQPLPLFDGNQDPPKKKSSKEGISPLDRRNEEASRGVLAQVNISRKRARVPKTAESKIMAGNEENRPLGDLSQGEDKEPLTSRKALPPDTARIQSFKTSPPENQLGKNSATTPPSRAWLLTATDNSPTTKSLKENDWSPRYKYNHANGAAVAAPKRLPSPVEFEAKKAAKSIILPKGGEAFDLPTSTPLHKRVRGLCEHPNCSKQPKFGFGDETPTFCEDHQIPGMISKASHKTFFL